MSQFLINGVERPLPIGENENLGKLIDYCHERMTHENSLVSSIKVNGVELGVQDESSLSEIPLSNLESVEVTFTHPRELAEETLQILKTFTERTAALSRSIADDYTNGRKVTQFHKLLDGVETITETLRQVKSILRVGMLQPVDVLEADLASILKDLTDAVQKKDDVYKIQLLGIHLPTNLDEWCSIGIPALSRSRDS